MDQGGTSAPLMPTQTLSEFIESFGLSTSVDLSKTTSTSALKVPPSREARLAEASDIDAISASVEKFGLKWASKNKFTKSSKKGKIEYNEITATNNPVSGTRILGSLLDSSTYAMVVKPPGTAPKTVMSSKSASGSLKRDRVEVNKIKIISSEGVGRNGIKQVGRLHGYMWEDANISMHLYINAAGIPIIELVAIIESTGRQYYLLRDANHEMLTHREYRIRFKADDENRPGTISIGQIPESEVPGQIRASAHKPAKLSRLRRIAFTYEQFEFDGFSPQTLPTEDDLQITTRLSPEAREFYDLIMELVCHVDTPSGSGKALGTRRLEVYVAPDRATLIQVERMTDLFNTFLMRSNKTTYVDENYDLVVWRKVDVDGAVAWRIGAGGVFRGEI